MITCTFEQGKEVSLRHITVGVILLNKDKNKILLIKRANIPEFLEPNKFGLPGGFMDRDESTKQTAIREALEETGYKIKIDQLFCINDNPDRPHEDRQNVEFVYLGQALEKVQEFDNEIQSVHWFDLDYLPDEKDFAFDHFKNLNLYKKYRSQPFPLPILHA